MPKIDIPLVVAIAAKEPPGGVVEQHRANREFAATISDLTEMDMLARVPTKKGYAHATKLLRDWRAWDAPYGSNLSPCGSAWLITGMMTEAPSRKAASRRAFAIHFAPFMDGVGNACPVTGEEFFGGAFVRLLTDETVFARAREITVAGDQGVATIQWRDGQVSRFEAVGPDFDADQVLVSWRSLPLRGFAPCLTASPRRSGRTDRESPAEGKGRASAWVDENAAKGSSPMTIAPSDQIGELRATARLSISRIEGAIEHSIRELVDVIAVTERYDLDDASQDEAVEVAIRDAEDALTHIRMLWASAKYVAGEIRTEAYAND